MYHGHEEQLKHQLVGIFFAGFRCSLVFGRETVSERNKRLAFSFFLCRIARALSNGQMNAVDDVKNDRNYCRSNAREAVLRRRTRVYKPTLVD